MAAAIEHASPSADVEKETANNTGIKKVIPKGLEEKLLKHSHDADAAMKAYDGMEGQVIELTEEKNRALLRKIDMHLMPVSLNQRIDCCTMSDRIPDHVRRLRLELSGYATWHSSNSHVEHALTALDIDKTTLSYASIMGLRLPPSDNKLQSGINLKGDEYSWLSSMFYFGYIAWEYPTTRLLQLLPLGKYCKPFCILCYNLQKRLTPEKRPSIS